MPKHHNLQEVIRPRNLPQVTGLSRTSCWRLGKDPTSGFPKPIHLSTGAVGYFRHELEAWLESRQSVEHDSTEAVKSVAVVAKLGRKPKNQGGSHE